MLRAANIKFVNDILKAVERPVAWGVPLFTEDYREELDLMQCSRIGRGYCVY